MTIVTVDRVLTRIRDLEIEMIDPVSENHLYAHDNIPYTISTADMPLFVNFPGGLEDNSVVGTDEFGREMREVRNYNLVLYHSPYGSGIEGEKLGLLRPYFDLVYEQFGHYPHLKNLGGVIDSLLVGDEGVGTVTFSGQTYFGIKFTLQVTTRVRRLYGPND
jgi:hypothetical protein